MLEKGGYYDTKIAIEAASSIKPNNGLDSRRLLTLFMEKARLRKILWVNHIC